MRLLWRISFVFALCALAKAFASIPKESGVKSEEKIFVGEEVAFATSTSHERAGCKCLNGLCVADVNGTESCQCPAGFGPRLADQITECQKCDCGSEFNCTFAKEGKIIKTWEKHCICPEGFRQSSDVCKGDCSGNPCKNNGTCRVSGNGIQCECTSKFKGEFCEKERPDCHCLSGICEEDDQGREVCICPDGYGPRPTDSGTECLKCNCRKDASCTFAMVKDFLFIKNWKKLCQCPEGYKDVEGVCKGDCSGSPCKNGGTCTVVKDDIACQCLPGFRGNFCETQRDCTCLNGMCLEGEDGKDTCKCPLDYGPLVADPVTECRKCDCGRDFSCVYEKRGWIFKSWKKQCKCPEGYKEAYGVCKGDCSGTPCKNGGTCFVENDGIKCACAKGFRGENCEKLKEECRCLNGQCKVDKYGEAVCTCPPEFGPRQEDPVTECHKCDCGNGFSCLFSKEAEWIFLKNWKKHCICPEGYKEDQGVCRGDCSGFPCKNGGKCRIEGNGIKCDCLKGFFGDFCESH